MTFKSGQLILTNNQQVNEAATTNTVAALQATIEAIEINAALYEEQNFDERTEAIDLVGFGIIDRIEELLKQTKQSSTLQMLKHHAEKLRDTLEEIDNRFFEKLWGKIKAGEYRGDAFNKMVSEFAGVSIEDNRQEQQGYNNLDVFINALLSTRPMPQQTIVLEPEMVYYQKTPASVVFEMVRQYQFTCNDVFFDIGSGLGQVAILVNLLTGIAARGIEFEPAFCNYAVNCAAELNLNNVTFVNIDARRADYSAGTVFFMYTPFNGNMLLEVLEMLRKESLIRKITIITYGPCTAQVALQTWLQAASHGDNPYKPCVFRSW